MRQRSGCDKAFLWEPGLVLTYLAGPGSCSCQTEHVPSGSQPRSLLLPFFCVRVDYTQFYGSCVLLAFHYYLCFLSLAFLLKWKSLQSGGHWAFQTEWSQRFGLRVKRVPSHAASWKERHVFSVLNPLLKRPTPARGRHLRLALVTSPLPLAGERRTPDYGPLIS